MQAEYFAMGRNICLHTTQDKEGLIYNDGNNDLPKIANASFLESSWGKLRLFSILFYRQVVSCLGFPQF